MFKTIIVTGITLSLVGCAGPRPWRATDQATEDIDVAKAQCQAMADSATAGQMSLQAASDNGGIWRNCMIGKGFTNK